MPAQPLADAFEQQAVLEDAAGQGDVVEASGPRQVGHGRTEPAMGTGGDAGYQGPVGYGEYSDTGGEFSWLPQVAYSAATC